MQQHEKHNNDGNTQPASRLLNTRPRFGKTSPSPVSEHNTIDFHLEMIKKIDKLIDEHEKETIAAPAFDEPPFIPPHPPAPIEPRPPLNKTFSHEEITWKTPLEPPRTHTQTIPEEFKTELSIIPEFRFITSHEFLETISQTPSIDDRIEVIDINNLTGETTSSHEVIHHITMKNQNDLLPVSTLMQEDFENEELMNKKIEVINVQTLKGTINNETFVNASTEADQSEEKAKIFFQNKKDTTDKKQKNYETEQSDIPEDIEERIHALNEKKKKEEKKRLLEEKPRTLQAEQDKPMFEPVPSNKKHLDKEPLSSKDISSNKTARELKKELKEQKRLQQLAIRKARIEQRQRKKKEKEMSKLQRKQEHLEQIQKRKSKSKPFDIAKEKKDESSVELDEDIRKVLVITDYLLGELPEDVLNIFLESKEFELYEKVLNKYKIK